MDDKKAYKSITHDIGVSVEPFYLDQESEPEESHYVWGYQVHIKNHGSETVQLERRHWIITDGNGETHEVEGEGVVGEQPVLEPGDAFVIPPGMATRYSDPTDDIELLEVTLPGRFGTQIL